jgi:hypothetical protein
MTANPSLERTSNGLAREALLVHDAPRGPSRFRPAQLKRGRHRDDGNAARRRAPRRAPCTAGKTTLLNHIPANRDGLKVAVIVNDMSEVNVDEQLMKNGSASLSRVDERLVEMQNG